MRFFSTLLWIFLEVFSELPTLHRLAASQQDLGLKLPKRSLQRGDQTDVEDELINLALNARTQLSSVATVVHENPAIGAKQGLSRYAVDGDRGTKAFLIFTQIPKIFFKVNFLMPFFNSGLDYFLNGCAQTHAGPSDSDSYPWLRIDLGRREHIGLVRLWPRIIPFDPVASALAAENSADSDVRADGLLSHYEFRVGDEGQDKWASNNLCSMKQVTSAELNAAAQGDDSLMDYAGVTATRPEGVILTPGRMNSIICMGFGRYVYVVVKKRKATLSLCEVEVIGKGPAGRIFSDFF